MKTQLISLLGVVSLFLTGAAEASMFRPFLSCHTLKDAIEIDVQENVLGRNSEEPYRAFVIFKKQKKGMIVPNVAGHTDLYSGRNGNYRFKLKLSGEVNDLSEYMATYKDNQGVRAEMACSYHVTFGN